MFSGNIVYAPPQEGALAECTKMAPLPAALVAADVQGGVLPVREAGGALGDAAEELHRFYAEG
jgi:hypothetical protein